MYRAVIFDWGGVVAPESDGGWKGYFTKLVQLPQAEADSLWDVCYEGLSTGSINERVFWKRAEAYLGRKLPESKHNIWKKGAILEPWPEMLDFAEKLRDNGLNTAVLSNTIPNMPQLIGKRIDYSAFSPVILSAEIGFAKPDGKIYKLILDELNLPSKDCIYIDNELRYLEPAQILGMGVVHAEPNNPLLTIKRAKHLLGITP